MGESVTTPANSVRLGTAHLTQRRTRPPALSTSEQAERTTESSPHPSPEWTQSPGSPAQLLMSPSAGDPGKGLCHLVPPPALGTVDMATCPVHPINES